MTLLLTRNIANKLAGVYFPTFLITFVSFISFWLGPENIADRINLGITAVLAMITQLAQDKNDLPSLSYLTVSNLSNLMHLIQNF